jgi:predicted nucleotidyltransferase
MVRLEEAQSIGQEDRRLMLDLKEIVERQVPGASVCLYGSVARGERTPESDYDVLVLTPEQLTRDQEATLRRTAYELELERDVVISLILCTRDEWEQPITKASPYFWNVNREGIVIC